MPLFQLGFLLKDFKGVNCRSMISFAKDLLPYFIRHVKYRTPPYLDRSKNSNSKLQENRLLIQAGGSFMPGMTPVLKKRMTKYCLFLKKEKKVPMNLFFMKEKQALRNTLQKRHYCALWKRQGNLSTMKT